MTYKDSLLEMYRAEIDCLRSAYLKEKKESFNLKYLSLLSILKLAKTTKDALCITS